MRNCRHGKPMVCTVTSSTHWCCGCVYVGDKCFCNGSGLPTHSATSAVPMGETTALAVPNSAGLSQTTFLVREQTDKESCLGKIRPGSGSLCEARHFHVGRLSAGGLILHRGEGLALWVTTGLEEAAKGGSYSYLSPGLSWRGNGLGGKERGLGERSRVLLAWETTTTSPSKGRKL